jgi:hypothetical protein
MGRFISRDPLAGIIENPLSQNPYLYCQNNPVNFVDLLGQQFGCPYATHYSPQSTLPVPGYTPPETPGVQLFQPTLQNALQGLRDWNVFVNTVYDTIIAILSMAFSQAHHLIMNIICLARGHQLPQLEFSEGDAVRNSRVSVPIMDKGCL